MLIDTDAFEKARRARDPRFDGRFFVGVKTTGIYCRPVCPVKMPRAGNVVFFLSAAAASDAGFRPCLRCRPESSPGTPAWNGTSTTVARALRMISAGALDDGTLSVLCSRLGVSTRHLNRLFARHLGVAPGTIAQTRRLQFAKKLIDETSLSMTDIALSSGYGSVRRFNDHFRSTYGRAPGALRKQGPPEEDGALQFTLRYRAPFDFKGLISFLALRAIPGVETVCGNTYSRTIWVAEKPARLSVTDASEGSVLCRVSLANAGPMIGIAEGVRRLFDLDAVPGEIESGLSQDPQMAHLVGQNPGLRLPGAWDAFEMAIRAIVGQQISVQGATTVMGWLVSRFGQATSAGRLFPRAEDLAGLDPDDLPMPGTRARAIRELARIVANGGIDFEATPDEVRAQLVAIRGIGPWTAQYIAMRSMSDPDAFLDGDLVLQRMASRHLGVSGVQALRSRAELWRPWRAYACMHLWRQAAA